VGGGLFNPLPIIFACSPNCRPCGGRRYVKYQPLLHARSSKANWIEKLLISPHHEHYHLEHHFLATAPSWNLPKLHAILIKEGLIPEANQASGIFDVLRRATTKQ
jgi:fatty acid desaturase